jgi:hypothetical protein
LIGGCVGAAEERLLYSHMRGGPPSFHYILCCGDIIVVLMRQLFELPMSKYNETVDTRTELQLLKRLWDFKELVRFSYDDWQTALWNDVNTEVLEDKNKKLSAQLKRFGDSNQIVKGWQVRAHDRLVCVGCLPTHAASCCALAHPPVCLRACSLASHPCNPGVP